MLVFLLSANEHEWRDRTMRGHRSGEYVRETQPLGRDPRAWGKDKARKRKGKEEEEGFNK